MRISIDTDILKRENIPIGEFLVLLMGHFNANYRNSRASLVSKGLIEPDLFSEGQVVLSHNTEALIARIITDSDPELTRCSIKDFRKLACTLISLYPPGNKPGTTYQWAGKPEEVEQKLKTLVTRYHFSFTEAEAISAVKEYISCWKDPKYAMLLPYFILRTKDTGMGYREMESLFMTIIENNRENENNN